MADTEQGEYSGKPGHAPVLLDAALDFLGVRRGGTYIDATVGLGGHSFAIAKRLGAQGRLIGVDKDPEALAIAQQKLQPPPELEKDWPKVVLMHASFAEIAAAGSRFGDAEADGLLADLGVSSLQLGAEKRGFSFQAAGPLDMRMNPHADLTADQVVNQFDERTLAGLLYTFGDERRSRRIARAIVRSRPIRDTAQLAQIVGAAARTMNSPRARVGRLHPATRTFQAIRIVVNQELEDLQELLGDRGAVRVLKPTGRLVVISFHSLEDRIVKESLRSGGQRGIWKLVTRKPLFAGEEEIRRNPRARSARLRAAEKN